MFELRKKKLLNEMKSPNFKGERAKMLNNISFFEINMLRGPYFQEGYKIGYGLWDLENKTNATASKAAGAAGQPEEEAYDDEF